jgi:hypothetical protein
MSTWVVFWTKCQKSQAFFKILLYVLQFVGIFSSFSDFGFMSQHLSFIRTSTAAPFGQNRTRRGIKQYVTWYQTVRDVVSNGTWQCSSQCVTVSNSTWRDIKQYMTWYQTVNDVLSNSMWRGVKEYMTWYQTVHAVSNSTWRGISQYVTWYQTVHDVVLASTWRGIKQYVTSNNTWLGIKQYMTYQTVRDVD